MINNNISPGTIILASKSPRRIRMFERLEIDFAAVESFVDEDAITAAKPDDLVQLLSIAKTDAVSCRYPEHWVVGADSIVAIDDVVLNKPSSPKEAEIMMTRLSGRTHRVMTGYSIFHQKIGHRFTDVVISEVTFKNLREEEIDWYTSTQEPYDKAGGYAIQGTGAFMVTRISGSYTNVVGLPLAEVIDHLAACNALSRINRRKKLKV